MYIIHKTDTHRHKSPKSAYPQVFVPRQELLHLVVLAPRPPRHQPRHHVLLLLPLSPLALLRHRPRRREQPLAAPQQPAPAPFLLVTPTLAVVVAAAVAAAAATIVADARLGQKVVQHVLQVLGRVGLLHLWVCVCVGVCGFDTSDVRVFLKEKEKQHKHSQPSANGHEASNAKRTFHTTQHNTRDATTHPPTHPRQTNKNAELTRTHLELAFRRRALLLGVLQLPNLRLPVLRQQQGEVLLHAGALMVGGGVGLLIDLLI